MAPSAGTIVMLFGCFHAMGEMIKIRYAAKDDAGKPLLPHPYTPWTPVDPKYHKMTDKAFRSFKMFENVKEWTLLSVPLMWIFSLYGGTLPLVDDDMVDVAVVLSSAFYAYATSQYISGYIESPKNRLKGFQIRRRVCEFWLFGSVGSVFWAALQRFGLTGGF
jgi:hypothetical protein